jgi:nickel/cobalt transporter (NiCoT) family protein
VAALNLVILIGIVRVFAAMRGAPCEEAELELRLRNRGLINRVFTRATGAISRPVQIYPVGALFGLGFDTASEVALLVLAGGAAGAGLPWYAILCLPILFAAGMSLMDSAEGAFMTLAYGWALADPVRRVYYNITVTGLSVLVAFVIGTIELGGLMAEHLNLSGAFWSEWKSIDLNALGFMITGLFAVTLLLAAAVWRLGRIGERWARGRAADAGDVPVSSTP